MSLLPADTSPQDAPAPARSPRRLLIRSLKWILLLLVLGLVGRALYRQLALIDLATLRFRPAPLLGAVAALLVVPLVQLVSYRVMLGAYAHAPPWGALAAAAWIPMLGKYIPGKLASFAGAVYLLRKFQIPGAIALSVVLALDGMMIVTGLIVGAPLLLWPPVQQILPLGWLWCMLVIMAGLVCLHPQIYGRIVNFALRRLRRQPLDHMPPLRVYGWPVICCFVQWIAVGLTLWLLGLSVGQVSAQRLPLLVGIGGLAYTVSYLVLFAPGGFGVREAIFLGALKNVVVPAPAAAIVVVGTRIVQILVELLIALVGMLILRIVTARAAQDRRDGLLASNTTR
ncbi:lysylphosphatidylglycerol synthase domain-containing protein [Fontivita pretiosa]|uniref:lysylphosphatidylglycerol synthase domain-containing protein n=1 Tax=Fontivita pretiosa TaxID=2989684 RepID=UPI003D182482